MRLAVDLDGVLYKWSETAAFLLNDHFGYQLGESNSWDYLQKSITNNEWQWLWTGGVEKGLFRHGHCEKGGIEALRALFKKGHDVVIVTSRPRQAIQDTLAWIGYHEIPASEIHILGPKVSKAKKVPNCDIYLDDKPTHVRDYSENTQGAAYLFDQPWNRGEEDLPRIKDWAHFLKVVDNS